mgnify:CR=1 FL=1
MYNQGVPVTISQFRKDLFKLAGEALEGKTVEFVHKGVVFQIVPERRISKLDRLVGRAVISDEALEQADRQMKAEIESRLAAKRSRL